MGQSPRILVVDDDESIRKILTAILEDQGYAVESADSANKAIRKTKSKIYNLALIDIRLPDMEGINLLTRMKDTTPKMRKIIITGYPTLKNAVEALNKGADAYIVKPFDMEKVLKKIKEQLKRQEEAKRYSQEKVAEFIKTRVMELEAEKKL